MSYGHYSDCIIIVSNNVLNLPTLLPSYSLGYELVTYKVAIQESVACNTGIDNMKDEHLNDQDTNW